MTIYYSLLTMKKNKKMASSTMVNDMHLGVLHIMCDFSSENVRVKSYTLTPQLHSYTSVILFCEKAVVFHDISLMLLHFET